MEVHSVEYLDVDFVFLRLLYLCSFFNFKCSLGLWFSSSHIFEGNCNLMSAKSILAFRQHILEPMKFLFSLLSIFDLECDELFAYKDVLACIDLLHFGG